MPVFVATAAARIAASPTLAHVYAGGRIHRVDVREGPVKIIGTVHQCLFWTAAIKTSLGQHSHTACQSGRSKRRKIRSDNAARVVCPPAQVTPFPVPSPFRHIPQESHRGLRIARAQRFLRQAYKVP